MSTLITAQHSDFNITASTVASPPASVSHTATVWCLCVLGNGELASGSADTSIKIWSSSIDFFNHQEQQQLKQTLLGHNGIVLALVSQGNLLFSGSRDRTIKIWNLGDFSVGGDENNNEMPTTALLRKTLYGHTEDVNALCLVPTSGDLVSGSWDHTINIWDKQRGFQLKSTLIDRGSAILSLCILATSPHSSSNSPLLIVSGSSDGTIKLWRPQLQQQSFLDSVDIIKRQMSTLFGHRDGVLALCSLAESATSSLIISAGAHADRTIKVWQIQDAASNLVVLLRVSIDSTDHLGSIMSLVVFKAKKSHKKSEFLVLSGALNDPKVCIWHVRKDRAKLKTTLNVSGGNPGVYSMVLMSKVQHRQAFLRLVGGCADGSIKMWDVK